MRARLMAPALIVVSMFLFAPRASACQECAEYFDWAAGDGCDYCQASYCGLFQCDVKQYFGTKGADYCVAGGTGCFEYGGNCSEEPSDDIHDPDRRDGPHAMNSGNPATGARLQDQWRLASVRVSAAQSRRVHTKTSNG
jgi:hypothetical protein